MLLHFLNEKSIVFTFLLLIASFGWVYVKLQAAYSSQYVLPLIIENLPSNKIPLKPIPSSIELNVEGLGSELLWQQLGLGQQELVLDFNDFEEQKIITSEQLKNELNKNVFDYRIKNIQPDTLFMQMEEGVSKKIPVKLKHNIVPKDGYALADKVQFSPDSITAFGPKSIMDSLDFWNTETLAFQNISQSKTGNVLLEKTKNSLRFQPNIIQYNFDLEPLTEITLTDIPIDFYNQKDTSFLLLSPNKVSISFSVPISKLPNIDASAFKIITDYDARNLAKQSKIPLKIAQQADNVSAIRINPNIVDFIIKTKND